MPCSSSEGMGDAYREDPEARRDLARMKAELDRVTALLCEVMGRVDNRAWSPAARKWYDAHRQWDESQGRKPG